MRIENSNVNILNQTGINNKDNPKNIEDVIAEKNDVNNKEQPAVVYDKSETDKKVDKNGHIYDAKAIAKLKQQTEANKLKLFDLIKRSIGKQGEVISYLEIDDIIKVPEDVRLEAQELISENGEFGIEKTSERILDFAKAISGDNPKKAAILRDAIDKGFKEAERMFGGELPQISKDTYARVMEKLDAWEKGLSEEPEKATDPVK